MNENDFTFNPVTGNHLVTVEDKERSDYFDGWVVEASSIGLPPGRFPKEIDLRFDDGSISTFNRSGTQYNDEDELMCVTYKSTRRTANLVVLND